MLSPKWFNKKLFSLSLCSKLYICDSCELYEECETSIKKCALYKQEKVKKMIDHSLNEFDIEHIPKTKDFYILDACKIVAIMIGKRDCVHLIKTWSYKQIDCKCIRYNSKNKWFHYRKKLGMYDKRYVYFALKCIKNPEFLFPDKESAPLIIRNDKITIFIAPRIYEEDDF